MAEINFDNVNNGIRQKSEIELICTHKPLLHEIEKAYGAEVIADIVIGYLFKFQSLLNIKDENKLNDYQISMCANNLIPFLRGMNIAEIVAMFTRFLSGEFGKFYGQIDIMTIGEWVREFKKKRGKIILDNKEVRKFVVKRDQNYDEDNVSWLSDK